MAAVAAARTALTIDPSWLPVTISSAWRSSTSAKSTRLAGRFSAPSSSTATTASPCRISRLSKRTPDGRTRLSIGRDGHCRWRRTFQARTNTLGLPLTLLDDRVAERFLTAAARRFSGGVEELLAVIEMRRGNAAAGFERMRVREAANPGNAGVTSLVNELAVYAETPDAASGSTRGSRHSRRSTAGGRRYTPRTLRATCSCVRGSPNVRSRSLMPPWPGFVRLSTAVTPGPIHCNQEAALQLMLGHRDAALDLFDKAIDAGAWKANSRRSIR